MMISVFYQAEVEARNRLFVMDPHLDKCLREIAKMLTSRDSKFGLLLCGACGNGKTTFLFALQSLINYLRDAGYFNARENVGMRIINAKEITHYAQNDYKEYLLIKSYQKILAIDDLGEEPHEVISFGNYLNPILELIEHRYNHQLSTFITSNLSPKEITEKYGERVGDRLNEMVSKIVFDKTIEDSYRRL